MSDYFNQASLIITDIARFDFQDHKPNNTGITTVASVVCQFDTLISLHNALGQVIQDHNAKLAK